MRIKIINETITAKLRINLTLKVFPFTSQEGFVCFLPFDVINENRHVKVARPPCVRGPSQYFHLGVQPSFRSLGPPPLLLVSFLQNLTINSSPTSTTHNFSVLAPRGRFRDEKVRTLNLQLTHGLPDSFWLLRRDTFLC